MRPLYTSPPSWIVSPDAAPFSPQRGFRSFLFLRFMGFFRVTPLARFALALMPSRPHCVLRGHPCFRPLVVGPAWRRQLRDAWRCCKWQLASKTVLIALHCLRAWMSDADSLQSAIDAGKASKPPEPELKLDVRARLGVLRRLLPGGLNTRDCNCRNSRHRKQGSSQRVCGLLCSQLPSPLPACFRVGFEAPAALVAKIH